MENIIDYLKETVKNHWIIRSMHKRVRLAFCYHAVRNCASIGTDLNAITRRNFAGHLQIIKNYFKPVTLQDFLENTPSKKPRVLITFDDGNSSDYTEAFQSLKKLDLPAVFYVTTDTIGKPGYLDEKMLREMASHPLMTIGSHSASHCDFGTLSKKRAELELTKSQARLSEITGKEITSFAYPFGNIWNMNEHDTALMQKLGYTSAFLLGMHYENQRWDPLRMPRLAVTDIPDHMLLRHSIAVLRSLSNKLQTG